MTGFFRRRGRRIAVALAVGLLLLTVAAGFFSRRLLTVESSFTKADYIVVLGGGGDERVDRAAELYKQEAAPRIIVTGSGDCEGNRLLLMNRGVPDKVIELECASTSTRENARFTMPLLQAHGAKSAIVVTSWFHSRRALACFKKYGDSLIVYSAPAGPTAGLSLGENLHERKRVLQEYFKIAGYWVCYCVCPF